MVWGVLAVFFISIIPLSAGYSSFSSNRSDFNRYHLAATSALSIYSACHFLIPFFKDVHTIHILISVYHFFLLWFYPLLCLCLMAFLEERPKFLRTNTNIKILFLAALYSVLNFLHFNVFHTSRLFTKEDYTLEFTGNWFIDGMNFLYLVFYFAIILFLMFKALHSAKTKYLMKLSVMFCFLFVAMVSVHIFAIIYFSEHLSMLGVFVCQQLAMLELLRIGNLAFLLRKPSYKLFEIFDKTEQAIVISDRDFNMIYSNKIFNSFFVKKNKLDPQTFAKSSSESLLGKSILRLLNYTGGEYGTDQIERDELYVDFSKNIRLSPEGGSIRYLYITNSTNYSHTFQYEGSIFLMRDITAYSKDKVELETSIKELSEFFEKNSHRNKDLEEKLSRETAYFNTLQKNFSVSKDMDFLTGALKKESFDRKLAELIENKIKVLGIITLKIRDYKSFVDTKGHRFVNKLVKNISGGIRGSLSETDLISRANSDTFYIVVVNFLSINDLSEKIEKLQADIEKYKIIDSLEVSVNSNAGLSLYPEHGKIAKELVAFSEIAMHKAEEDNLSLVIFSDELQQKIIEERRLDMEIREGTRRKEFMPFLQPVVKYVDGEKVIASYEALVRWKKPGEERPLSPYFFIDLAEKTGSVQDITGNVMEYTSEYIEKLLSVGAKNFKIAVNLCAKELKDPLFLSKIQFLLKKYSIEAKYMEFEITERGLIDDVNFVISILKKIREMGFTVSIDDFGQENSSLSYLKNLPVTKLKIDKAFVDEIPKPLEEGVELTDDEIKNNKKSELILQTIINLTKDLKIDVLAEGVEYGYQLEFLNKEGCHLIQGYHFYKPMSFEEILEKKIYPHDGYL